MKIRIVMRLYPTTKSRRVPALLLLFVSLPCALSVAFGYRIEVAGGTPLPYVRNREAIMVLERGENALVSSSADVPQTLKRILDGVPPDTPEFVRGDITKFLMRLPETGSEFECHHEFVRYRARQELARLQERLLSTDFQPAEPGFCYAVPFVIDLAQPIRNLEIYGYDFDAQPLALFILNTDGTFEDVSSALKKRTHYHLTIDLGPNGVKFTPQSQMLSVAWGHIVRYSVSLIQPTTDLCPSQIEEIPAGKTITFSPDLISGTPNLGAGAVARARVTLNYESDKVDATVCALAHDAKSDSTTFVGCSVEFVYTTDPERVIDGVLMPLESRSSWMRLNPGQNTFPGNRNGPVSKWILDIPEVQSNPAGGPVVTVVLGKIRIASTKIDNCLPAVAYLEARRRHALASTTIKRLDSRSKSIQKGIGGLRPRFAP